MTIKQLKTFIDELIAKGHPDALVTVPTNYNELRQITNVEFSTPSELGLLLKDNNNISLDNQKCLVFDWI
jgi:hypothetical protein